VETAEPARALAGNMATERWSTAADRRYVSTPLFRNATYLWVSTIVLSAFGFVFWTAAAWLYPADAVGYGAAAISAIALIAGFANLGLGFGLIRFLPERQESGARLINSVFLVTGAVGLAAAVIFLLGLDLWSPSLGVVRSHPIFAVTFLIASVALSLSTVLDQAFVATRTAHFVLIKNGTLSLGKIVLVAVFALFFASFGIVAAQGLAAAALVALTIFFALPAARRGYRPALQWEPSEVRSIFSFSVGNYAGALLFLAPGSVLTIMVLNILGPEEAAYFYVAWTIGQAASGFAGALSSSLFAEGSHGPDELGRIALRATIGGSLVALVMTFALLVLAEPVLRAFGPEYASNGSNLVRILALSIPAYLFLNIYVGVQRVRKRTGSIVIVAGAMAVTSLLAGYLLSHSMGLEGAGIGWLAGQGAALTAIAIVLMLGRHDRLPFGPQQRP
jgi:O-antigen/teichoic acid export membrane protein